VTPRKPKATPAKAKNQSPKVGESTPVNRGNAGKGRAKGVPNKATRAVKEALEEAFERRGGVDALLAWAAEEPSDFYALWAKLLPKNVAVDGAVTLRVVRT
jgi:hypothetical protein